MLAANSGLTFFVDRSLGSRTVPERLRAAGWHLVTMDERYGVDRSQSVTDVEWIGEAAARDEVLLGKDAKVARNPLEAAVIYNADARVFALANARLTGAESAAIFLHQEEGIVAMAVGAKGPYVVAVSREGLPRRRLNLPA